MAVRIRLTRMGAKKKPFYRIVAVDSETKRDGAFLEVLGTYDPHKNPAEVNVKPDALAKWLERGAKPSDTVASLLKSRGLLPKQASGEAQAS
ncbi:MAG: 30S ribosomal protein S16 [Deltaproteobacteria bacterium]|nr:30S ribosomal protein S16 [Deltaproteobacteria bacterium]